MLDPAAAVAFLERNFGQRSVMTFTGGRCVHSADASADAVRQFIDDNPSADLYFAIAELKPNVFGKPRKADCLGSRYVWVDCDPPKGLSAEALPDWRDAKRAELETLDEPRPHLIVDSGRGFWAYWRLSQLAAPDDVEAINKALSAKLGGDHCHDISRVARVPFTENSKVRGK